ncbi:perlucin-like protein [Asterias rubens]|uniref:perlucin-like protein n=1 Tax=Asterias rubens TaxID=7604 RepID=UPI0014555A9B|nr:perlucin-like protein [Asterias rubens]
MNLAFFVSFTALLGSCLFGLVATKDEQCSTFMSDDSSCPESWHYWGNSCYRVTEKTFTWADAKDECRNLGGVLGVPSSDQENEFTVQLIPLDQAVWLDCNDQDVEGRWKCREGNVEVAYRNWFSGEPNNLDGDEDCAVLTNGWRREFIPARNRYKACLLQLNSKLIEVETFQEFIKFNKEEVAIENINQ